MRNTRFKPGDYVRFLNEKQEGKVSAVTGDGKIIVDIEDGFPIEALPAELVLVQPDSGNQISQDQALPETPEPDMGYSVHDLSKQFGISHQIYCAVIPSAQQVSTGPVSIYLVNSTPMPLLYSLNLKQGKFLKGLHAGFILPGAADLLAEKNRAFFMDYEGLYFEGLYHQNELHLPRTRLQKHFELNFPAITQHFPHLPSPLAFARITPLFDMEELTEENLEQLVGKLKDEYGDLNPKKTSAGTGKKSPPSNDLLRSYGLSSLSQEVDLHIEEIIDSTSGMSNAEIVQVQLARFRKELDRAILQHSKKIIFIHGIGNGKLKSEIRRELKELKMNFKDAPFERYGSGATEVLLD
ncbi:MAG: Smr/MutS family protein [Bacteroidia bacterium]|nr:Smr/MutS family protein [Bacteroidia bacterium]